jgi:hypothetical protein
MMAGVRLRSASASSCLPWLERSSAKWLRETAMHGRPAHRLLVQIRSVGSCGNAYAPLQRGAGVSCRTGLAVAALVAVIRNWLAGVPDSTKRGLQTLTKRDSVSAWQLGQAPGGRPGPAWHAVGWSDGAVLACVHNRPLGPGSAAGRHGKLMSKVRLPSVWPSACRNS